MKFGYRYSAALRAFVEKHKPEDIELNMTELEQMFVGLGYGGMLDMERRTLVVNGESCRFGRRISWRAPKFVDSTDSGTAKKNAMVFMPIWIGCTLCRCKQAEFIEKMCISPRVTSLPEAVVDLPVPSWVYADPYIEHDGNEPVESIYCYLREARSMADHFINGLNEFMKDVGK